MGLRPGRVRQLVVPVGIREQAGLKRAVSLFCHFRYNPGGAYDPFGLVISPCLLQPCTQYGTEGVQQVARPTKLNAIHELQSGFFHEREISTLETAFSMIVDWADGSSNLYWRASIHRYINVATVLGNPFSDGSSAVSERMDLRRHRDRGRPAYWLAVAEPSEPRGPEGQTDKPSYTGVSREQ